jgi:hypothetical protein
MISEVAEQKKQHIENQKKIVFLKKQVAIIVAQRKLLEKSEADHSPE